MKKNTVIPLDANSNPLPLMPLRRADNYTDATIPAEDSLRIVRLASTTDALVYIYPAGGVKSGDGLLLPFGTIEYFSVPPGHVLEVSGSVNVAFWE